MHVNEAKAIDNANRKLTQLAQNRHLATGKSIG
jgi:hypothetical protein